MQPDPHDVQEAIEALSVDVPADVVLGALAKLEALERLVRQLREDLEPRVIEWIIAHGPIEHGVIRYYVGLKKTVKCIDKPGAADGLLTVSRGDLAMFCDLLCAQPYKVGSARNVLPPEVYERCFRTFEEHDLKEGKPVQRLQKLDTRFVLASKRLT